MFRPQGSYSLAARARLQAPHGAREPTARTACSGEAVQGSAKANANGMELLDGGLRNEPRRDENCPDDAPRSCPCVLAGYTSDVAD